MEKSLTITTFMLFGFIWMNIYWFESIVLFFFVATILSTIDIVLWVIIARKEKKINSVKMTHWIFRKVLLILIILILQVVLFHVSYVIENNYISMWGLLLIVWYSAIEFLSILENVNKLNLNKHEKWMFSILHKLSEVILNKIKKKVEEKIEEKVEEKVIYKIEYKDWKKNIKDNKEQ